MKFVTVSDRIEALVSTLTLFYYLGHIGIIAGTFRQNFPEAYFNMFHAYTNFHAQNHA